MEKVFFNGQIIDIDDAKVSVSNSGFLYGMGLFETMRCTAGKVFALDDHLNRLFNSSKSLSINIPHDKEYIKDAINHILEANNLINAQLRLTITNSPMSKINKSKSTLLITVTKFSPYSPHYYQKGSTVILSEYKQNPTDPIAGHKTTAIFSRILALNMAHQRQAIEALWFTDDGYLAEGCISNVFLIKDSILFTPPLETPVLDGIARKTVCQIAKKRCIKLVEKKLTMFNLLTANEVFLTNVIMLILPVVAVEDLIIGHGRPGAITKKLLNDFNEILSPEDKENCC